MADAKLTALTAASALAGADLFYVSQSAASRKATGTQLLALVGTAYVPLAGDATMTGALRISTLYTDASNYERLTLTGVAGTSVNITAETLGTGGDNLDIVLTPAGAGSVYFPGGTYVSSTGYFITSGVTAGGNSSVNYHAVGFRTRASGEVAWTSGYLADAVDTALFRDSAGVAKVTDGGSNYRDLKLRNLIQTEYSQLTEMTAPSAPATNSVRIYAEDNGAGKTRLMALFATGSAVQLGIEP